MQAVILSGGFGTRLSHIVSDVPKPMAPVGDKPFLDYLISILKQNGFNKFLFLNGYKADIIENHYKHLENSIFVTEEKSLGSGGALLNAFEYLDDEFFIINGDTFFDIDYSLLKNFSYNKPATIALRYANNVDRYGFVDINDDFIVKSFVEKGQLPNDKIDGYINAGICLIKKYILKEFFDNFDNEFISLETEIFPKLLNSNQLFGLPLGGCFIDIGVPEDYYRAQNLIPNWFKKASKPALFIDKDGTIIVNTEYPSGKNFKIIYNTVEIVKKYSELGYYIVMVTNQAGIAKNKFNFDMMYEGFDGIKEYYKNFDIIFDDIQFCPYHKDGVIKEYAYDSILRKPNAGMILQACEKFKIDLKNSIMIGDKRDIDCIKLPYLNCKILGE